MSTQVIKDLQERVDKLATQATKITNDPEATQEQFGQAQAMLDERDQLLERLETAKAAQAAHDALMKPEREAPVTTSGPVAAWKNASLSPRARMLALIETPEYKDAFFENALNGTPFPAEFRNIITTDATGQDGSAVIPLELEASIDAFRELANPFRGLARVTSSMNDRDVPLRTADAAAARFAENASITVDTTYALSKIVLIAHKMGVIVQATTEALEDAAVDLEADLVASIGRAFGNLEETEIVSTGGDGSSAMESLKDRVGTSVELAANSAIDYDSVIDMVYGSNIEAAHVVEAMPSWVMNHSIVGEMRKVKDDNNMPIWQAGMGGEPDRLLGFPIARSKAMPSSLGSNTHAVAFFGDFSQYRIHDRRMFNIRRLNELYAGNDAVGWLATARNDGAIVRATAFNQLNCPI